MKTSLRLLVLLGVATALAGCSDDNPTPGGGAGADSGGDAGESSSAGKAGAGTSGKGGGASGGETGVAGSPDDAGAANGGNSSGGGPIGEAGAGGEAGAPDNTVAWYQCQSTDQAWVRRALTGVLGRHAYGQAEVNMYADMISQIDALDGYDPEAKITAPITALRHSRQVALNAMMARPEYQSNWVELYRDFLRMPRLNQTINPGCTALRVRTTDAKEVARWVRDQPADGGGDGKAAPTFADVVFGSIELDDITPIYTENLFTMITKSYDGANALEAALDLSRRADYGAWFDGTYLNRDAVCLGCHNSEFSVTQSSDPTTNRHYPVPGFFEKALFGDSTGPALLNGFDGADRLHGAFRRAQFLVGPSSLSGGIKADCGTASAAQITAATTAGTLPTCASGDPFLYCQQASAVICTSKANRDRRMQPWGLAALCGQFIGPADLPIDQSYVETRLGNIQGYRTSMWDVAASLRAGFNKLQVEGLGADAEGNIADADKALSYMVTMTIAEKVWREIVGTPLTIANYFPRNAAARDELQTLTETLIKSGYSNKALLSTILGSPYLNMAAPESGCVTDKYGAPRIFDPWRMAELDPTQQGNGVSDGVQPMSARTQARSAYAALGWPLAPYGATLVGGSPAPTGYGENPIAMPGVTPTFTSADLEGQFQIETGFALKNSQPGFRGLDFQARLGWEDRFAQCKKIFTNTAPDVIDGLVASAKPGVATLGDLLKVLKDRFIGEPIDATERAALQTMVGASFDADASTVPDLDGSLRRVCGAMITSPQFLMLGLQPRDGSEVPAATPTAYSYQTLCSQITLPASDKLSVTCTSGQPLTVNVAP